MTDEDTHMRTSMTQEDWDEFARAIQGFIDGAQTFAAVLLKFQDDLPLTTEQRTQVQNLRGRGRKPAPIWGDGPQ